MILEKDYYGSPRWSWEILDCAMPMTFDTYSNCAHQCLYCFAYFQRAIGGAAQDYLAHRVKAVNVEKVKRMFLNPDKYAGQFAGYIKNKFVLQWGGLSDGFDWYERKFRKSLELLRFFKEIDYPVSISTKGTWFLDDPEYIGVIRDAKNTHWKYSIITLDEERAKKMEAGVVSSRARFEAMRKLNDLGVGATTFRFRPFVIGLSDEYIEPMMKLAKEVGCYSVTSEFLCLEKRAGANHRARYDAMSKLVGYDLWDFYRTNSFSGSGLMRLNYDIKRVYFDRMAASAKDNGLAFFVSDAHHKERSNSAGCCGLPPTGVLSQYNRGQFAEAILIAKRTGQVRWGDIEKDAEWMKEIPFYGASGYNTGSTKTRAKYRYHTMFDYMREMWNNPRSWSSPARYFGGALVPSSQDGEGNIVYLYNKPFVSNSQIVSTDELKRSITENALKMQEDGGAMAHITAPVFVVGTKKSIVCGLLDKNRINYEVVSTIKKAHTNGNEYDVYAWIRGDVCGFLRDGEDVTPRAIISDAEAEMDIHEDINEITLTRKGKSIGGVIWNHRVNCRTIKKECAK